MTSQTAPLCRKSPWLRSATALALATAVTVPTVLLAQAVPQPSPQAAAPSGPEWPANTKVIQTKLAKLVPLEGRTLDDFPLPQLRVYDKQGRRVLERLGYYAPTFSSFLTRTLSGGSPADASHLLAHEIDLVHGPDGKPLSALPEADYTIVDYWASWCLPCRAQDRDLLKVLAARPGVRVNLVKVEADLSQKTPQEVNKMIEAGRESAAARKKTQG
jgi:thiol-disulfide isomerase/thioredoxin